VQLTAPPAATEFKHPLQRAGATGLAKAGDSGAAFAEQALK
jgi:hypothetical protein